MKGVPLLLRMAQSELKERRSDLGFINRAQSETETAIAAHDATVMRETRIALDDPAAIPAFGRWSGHAAGNRTKLQSRYQDLETSAHTTRERVRDAVAQVRRLEIVLDTQRAKARRLAARRAEARTDERELARRTDERESAPQWFTNRNA